MTHGALATVPVVLVGFVGVVGLGGLGVTSARAVDAVTAPETTRSANGVTLRFPAVTYRPPDAAPDDVAAHARVVSETLGAPVDPETALFANATNRMIFRHPTRPEALVKIYKAGVSRPRVVARLLQRELALAAFMREVGIPFAAVEAPPRYLERGIVVQTKIDGRGLDERYPRGYHRGADAAVDAVLDRIAAHDEAVKEIVQRALSVTVMNDLDCSGHKRPVGFDLGRCYENVLLTDTAGAPVLIDW